MQKITPFLWFDKEAEEAMTYYVEVFNNSPYSSKDSKVVSIHRYPEGPLEEPMKGMEGKVLTGVFTLGEEEFMALDGGPMFKFNESVSFLVKCKDQSEVDYFWDTLTSNGGQESMCGWLKDKFGLSWQIIPEDFEEVMSKGTPEQSKRVMDTLLKMKKIVIADLQKAFEG